MKPVNWLVMSARWVWLSMLPIIAGLSGVMSLNLAYILIGWTLLSFLASLADAAGWKPPLLQTAVLVADLGFALAAVASTGMLASPLWWTLLIAAVSTGLRLGTKAVVVVSALGGIAAAIMIILLTATTPWVLVPLTLQTLALIIAGGILGWLANLVRSQAMAMERRQTLELAKGREQERERARTIFRMASALNATLNYEEILEMALDFGESTLSRSRSEDDQLVSALLLFSEGKLSVASARRLTHADWRASLAGEEGVIHHALSSGDAQIIQSPANDPELGLLAALQACSVALCIPLSSGLEAHGILIFAHHDAEHLSDERVELLQAIGEQAMIALQNARLYRDLLQEKERIIEIQEEARKQLARDLHDGPTQSVATVAMRINFIRRLMERDPKAVPGELQKVESIARRTTKEIRHMLFTLRPLILETQGLVAALQQLAEKMRDTHGQEVYVVTEDEFSYDLEIGKQAVLFYIAEEAVNNARKHAEAEHVWLRIRSQENMFLLEVEDDGVGFNVGSVDSDYEQRGSLGMVNMRERAELVHGELRVDSAEGKGTRIRVFVPLTEESAERLQSDSAK
jgi:signal transduction histidine kinase